MWKRMKWKQRTHLQPDKKTIEIRRQEKRVMKRMRSCKMQIMTQLSMMSLTVNSHAADDVMSICDTACLTMTSKEE